VEDDETDASLVERARGGDRDAFAAVVERYQQALGSYLWRLTRDRELAADLAQETFLRAYRSLAAMPTPVLVRPWLYRIATNLANDEFRRRRRFSRVLGRAFGRSASTTETVAIEERELVQLALERLNPTDQAVLLLCAVEQLSYREVAETLGISSEAVRKQFTRAKERFRVAYADILPKSLQQAS
jgi:RNA polymerase sigma-70 factor, ECF subfamily